MAKKLIGVVVSTNMKDTVVVRVEEQSRHPLYRKVIKKHAKFFAHVGRTPAGLGDTVEITESRPLSKRKHFVVTNNTTKR